MIPQEPEDLTADWLDSALHETGVLAEAHVTDVAVEPFGDGQGLASRLLRLRLTYDRNGPGSPATLIVKLPSGLETNRVTAEMVGAYEREIRFYRELAQRVEIRTPRHYYSAMDSKRLEGSPERLDKLLGWIPTPALGLLPLFSRWLAARSTHRYVLLMEDLAPARAGNQLAGCTAEDATRALQSLAATHASLWQSPDLDAIPWLRHSDVAARVRHAVFRRNRRRFLREYQTFPQAPEEPPLDSLLAAVDWLDAHGLAMQRRLAAPPRTLVHGDYRLDNLFFGSDGDAAPVAAVDWAMVHLGRGIYDVAYFVGCSLEPELAREIEEDLVRHYHETLLECGVKDYAHRECWRDYQLSKLLFVQAIVLSIEALEVSEEQLAELGASFVRRLAALLPEEGLDDLLS